MTYWHFAADYDGTPVLAYGQEPIIVGETYVIEAKPILCERGFHAAKRAIDALRYAQGPWASRVSLGGKVIDGGDKLVASERTHHVVVDATDILHEFALWCASRALKAEHKAGRESDPRSRAALKVKRAWLKGKATNEELAAAAGAAEVAAAHAEGASAADGEGAAAWAAAWATVAAAATGATYAATAAATASAAWEAEEKAQNRKLTAMLARLIKETEA
jgi:hypothetical protein